METQSYSGVATQVQQRSHHRHHHDTEAGDRWRGKSALSVGHRAKAPRAQGCNHGAGCRTQGEAASMIAQGLPSGQALTQAIYVNVSYTMVALSLTAGAAAAPEGAPVAQAPVAPDPAGPEGTPEAAETAPVEAVDLDEPEQPEDNAGSAPSGVQVSAFYYEAQLSYMSASVALELLR